MRLRRFAYWFIGLLGLVVNIIPVAGDEGLSVAGLLAYLSEQPLAMLLPMFAIIPLFAVVGYMLLRTDRLLAARQQTETALRERVKELQCLYGTAESIRSRETTEEIFQDVAALIPPGWQHPEITRGKVIFDGIEYVSELFEETPWQQSSPIVVDEECRGAVAVYYLEERSELDQGPFLNEERNLIDGLARALAQMVERSSISTAVSTLRAATWTGPKCL